MDRFVARRLLGLKEGDENMDGLIRYEEDLKNRMEFASRPLMRELEREMEAVHTLKAYLEAEDEDDKWERYLDELKADVACTLGMEEGSDEWYELMMI